MNALAIIANAGVQASVVPAGGLKLKGLSKLTIEQKNQLIDYARKHKPEIVNALTKCSASGECESCPAAGYWDYKGPGKWCFHRAYFLGKSGHPIACDMAMRDCPLSRAEKNE